MEEEIHGVKIEIKNTESNSIKELIRSWKDHKTDFQTIKRNVDHDSNTKIYLGEIVFEKRDGKYILRKSSKDY